MKLVDAVSAEMFLDARALAAESPVWDDRQDGLWWVDVRAPRLHFNGANGIAKQWDMPSPIGFAALTQTPAVIVGLADGVYLFEPATSLLTFLFHPEPDVSGTRLNEGRVDPKGRLWFGVMEDKGRSQIGSVWRWTPAGPLEQVRTGVHIPNGMSFDVHDNTLSFADNADGRVLLLDMEAPEKETTLLPADAAPGAPDGGARDTEGYVWSARFGAGLVVRIAPDGTLERRISVPAPNVAGLCFGGLDNRTLFITTLRVRLTEDELSRWPLSGALFSTSAPAPGVPEHRLASFDLTQPVRMP